MAEEDCALLVGISRYKDGDQFGPLNGPKTDIQRVQNWLRNHQAVRRIEVFETPEALLREPPSGGWPPETQWTPDETGFKRKYREIFYGGQTKPLQREGRLYLYFSGHGFSLSNDEDDSLAALYGADSFGLDRTNLPGSIYAAAAKRAKAFKEVVLIMDCCRDLVDNYKYAEPGVTLLEAAGADKSVKMFELYAAPREGKSQERKLPDSNGAVVGLMTDALLRALRVAPSDVTGQVGSGVLKRVMEFNWRRWYPFQPAPPAPNAVLPKIGDIFFKSLRDDLVSVTLTFSQPLAPETQLELRSAAWTAVATVTTSSLSWQDLGVSWVQETALTQVSATTQQITLVLPPGQHGLTIGSATHSFDPGASNAVAL